MSNSHAICVMGVRHNKCNVWSIYFHNMVSCESWCGDPPPPPGGGGGPPGERRHEALPYFTPYYYNNRLACWPTKVWYRTDLDLDVSQVLKYATRSVAAYILSTMVDKGCWGSN